jgi:tRNA pseudouridine32 synthase/23S rRNA pseudouridine746 synthase
LRVHLLSIGHPILGDSLYAEEPALSMAERLCLHATVLKFHHPLTGVALEFESAPPF